MSYICIYTYISYTCSGISWISRHPSFVGILVFMRQLCVEIVTSDPKDGRWSAKVVVMVLQCMPRRGGARWVLDSRGTPKQQSLS